MTRHLLLAGLVLLLVPACNESKAQETPQEKQANVGAAKEVTQAKQEKAPGEAETADQTPARTIEIASAGNKLEFDKTELRAKAGEKIKLVFHNNATLDVLPHNWVLVKPGTVEEVAAAGMAKGEAGGYVDPGPDVLAYSPLAKKGETVEFEFTAPEAAGTYPYVCTVMGHYVTMKGDLIVK